MGQRSQCRKKSSRCCRCGLCNRLPEDKSTTTTLFRPSVQLHRLHVARMYVAAAPIDVPLAPVSPHGRDLLLCGVLVTQVRLTQHVCNIAVAGTALYSSRLHVSSPLSIGTYWTMFQYIVRYEDIYPILNSTTHGRVLCSRRLLLCIAVWRRHQSCVIMIRRPVNCYGAGR